MNKEKVGNDDNEEYSCLVDINNEL